MAQQAAPPPGFGPALTAAPEEEEKGFFEELGEDYDKRVLDFTDSLERHASGEAMGLDWALQLAGGGVALVFDAGASAVRRTLWEPATAVAGAAIDKLPDAVKEQAAAGFDAAAQAFLESDAGQATIELAGSAAGATEDWYNTLTPSEQANLGAIGNIVSAWFPPARGGKAVLGPGVKKLGDPLRKSAAATAERERGEFVLDLVRPHQDLKVRKQEVGRTDVTPGGTKVTRPSRQEAESAAAVARIPEVKPSNTLQENYNAMQSAVNVKREALDRTLAREAYDPATFRQEFIDRVKAGIDEHPNFAGTKQGRATAESVVQNALRELDAQPTNLRGALDARRAQDRWVTNKKGKVHSPDVNATPLADAHRVVQQAMRDTIEARTANPATFRQSMEFQHRVLNAMENVQGKAAREATTRIGRAWDTLKQYVPTSPLTYSAATGLIGLVGYQAGAGAAVGSMLLTGAKAAGVGGTLYAGFKGYKALKGPEGRRALANLADGLAEAAKTAARNPAATANVVMKIREDQAAIQELLDESGGRPAEEEVKAPAQAAPPPGFN
jgi:hypothetical protein